MDQILDGLNDQQRAAVLHGRGPLLVVAGAGTGKTQVITRRIAYLVMAGRARPDQILALTFTEKAAREMEERLYELLGWQSFQVPVMTFNAFGSELLGRFATHVGRSVRGGLLNETQKALLLAEHIHEVDLKYFGFQTDMFEFVESIVSYIGLLQNTGVEPADYSRMVDGLGEGFDVANELEHAEQEDLARLYELYEAVKKKSGTYDYHDQLAIPLGILKTRPNLVKRLRKEFEYVLVDEYQDTNSVQDELLRTFITPDGNLFVVGDDDQAIYGFRGADINNILNFSEHFEVSKPAVLVQNYRSGQEILDCAYNLISKNNPDRLEAKYGIDKRLQAQHDGAHVEYRQYNSALDEQRDVVSSIVERVQSGQDPGNIAVLGASHAPLTAIAKLLRHRGIAYAVSTTSNIFEQPELLGLWHLLRWIAMDIDEEAMAHVLTGPFVSWTTDQYRRLLEASRDELVSVEEALRRQPSEAAKKLCAQIDLWRSWAQAMSVSRLVFKLVFESGKDVDWRNKAETSGRIVRVFEDLQRWLEQLQDFETVHSNATLVEYLKFFPKPPALENSEPQGDASGVQLLTVHAAKGLEFDTVFLVGCTNRSWSKGRGGMGLGLPDQLQRKSTFPPDHEYRRLLYVAVTRAKQHLLVSAASQMAGGGRQLVSPLVEQLVGKDLIERAVLQQRNSVSGSRLAAVMSELQKFYPLKAPMVASDLPFAASDGWLDLSVTGLSNYDYCPFEFYLEYVLKIRQPIGPQLAFGTLLHKAFEQYYRDKLSGHEPDLTNLQSLLDEQWSNKGYEREQMAEKDHQTARKAIHRFFEREQRANRQIVASEMPIRLVVSDAKLRVRGKIDAVFQGPEGVELRDFKTGRHKTDPEKLAVAAKSNFQLRTYALAYYELEKTLPARVVLDYVVTGVEGSAELSAAILKNHRDKLIAMAGKIRAGEFAPNVSPLHQCAAIKYYGRGEADELTELLLSRDE